MTFGCSIAARTRAGVDDDSPCVALWRPRIRCATSAALPRVRRPSFGATGRNPEQKRQNECAAVCQSQHDPTGNSRFHAAGKPQTLRFHRQIPSLVIGSRRVDRKRLRFRLMLVRRSRSVRKLAAAASAGAAALLALVLFVDVTQAGRSYVYCRSMQEVMPHACCQKHRASVSTTSLISNAPDCCESRVVPSLGTWASVNRPDVPTAPLLAIVARRPVELLALTVQPPRLENPLIRSGPPLSRVLAQLMVFRL